MKTMTTIDKDTDFGLVRMIAHRDRPGKFIGRLLATVADNAVEGMVVLFQRPPSTGTGWHVGDLAIAHLDDIRSQVCHATLVERVTNTGFREDDMVLRNWIARHNGDTTYPQIPGPPPRAPLTWKPGTPEPEEVDVEEPQTDGEQEVPAMVAPLCIQPVAVGAKWEQRGMSLEVLPGRVRVELPLEQYLSAQNKSIIVASSHGTRWTGIKDGNGNELNVAINLFLRPEAKKPKKLAKSSSR